MSSESALPRLGLFLFTALLFEGCSLFPAEEHDGDMMPRDRLQVQREKGFQRMWRGRPFHDLIAYFGTPKIMMDVPGNRPLRTTVAVYEITDKASDCIDAFTLVQVRRDELEVADYFCR
jgi:hypothetical protein